MNTEKFTEADVFANGNNDNIVDEGEFRENDDGVYFYSIISGEGCECENREMHESHLLKIMDIPIIE